MKEWRFSDHGISEDPRDGLQDLMAQVDEDTEKMLEALGDFFVECPDAWHQSCQFWVNWREAESNEEEEV
jgi:hypothetical protein